MPLQPGGTVASFASFVIPREAVSDPVLCHLVEAESSTVPPARLGHTIIAWARMSGKCTSQIKRAAQRVRREVGADRGQGPRPSVHDLESPGMLTTTRLLMRESESLSNKDSPATRLS